MFKPKTAVKLKRMYHRYSDKQVLLVLKLFHEHKMTIFEISKQLGMVRNTVLYMIESAHKRGTYKRAKPVGNKPWPIPEEVENYLLTRL